MKLQGKVAIVTGGGRGIGEGIVRCLAEEGANVAIVDINGSTARSIAEAVGSLGRESLAIEADATDSEKAVECVQSTIDRFGTIDILVNNVGGVAGVDLGAGMPAIDTRTDEEWQATYELNLKSHIIMARAVVPHFKGQRSGKIVNISSAAGKQGSPMLMPYSVFKSGDIAFTRALALELAPYNVNVNCILPGLIYTPLWEMGATALRQLAIEQAKAGVKGPISLQELERMTPKEWWLKTTIETSTPLRREQTPEDIGRAVVFLVSEDARNITAQALSVDGGQVRY
jgi:NAD(P)-dependent dehydrogenase (short-subunit alcohol dehydrogenase family)